MNPQFFFGECNWKPWKNTGSASVGPWELVELSGAELYGGKVVRHGSLPTDAENRVYGVNGPTAVDAGDYGHYQCGPEVIVAYETGTPAAGELWGPKENQGTAASDSATPSLKCVGVYDATNKLMVAAVNGGGGCRFYIGTTTAAVTAGTDFAVSSLTAIDGGSVPDPDNTSPDTWNVSNDVADGDGYTIDTDKVGKIIGWADGTLHPLDFPCPDPT